MEGIATNYDKDELGSLLVKRVTDAVIRAIKVYSEKESDILTEEDVMEILSISKSTIKRRRAKGLLKAAKVGNRYYYSRSQIYQMVEDRMM